VRGNTRKRVEEGLEKRGRGEEAIVRRPIGGIQSSGKIGACGGKKDLRPWSADTKKLPPTEKHKKSDRTE